MRIRNDCHRSSGDFLAFQFRAAFRRPRGGLRTAEHLDSNVIAQPPARGRTTPDVHHRTGGIGKRWAIREDLNAEIERLLGTRPTTFAYPCGEKFIRRGVEAESYVPFVAKRFLVGRGFRDEAANDPAFCDLAQVLGVDSDGMSFEGMKTAVLGASAFLSAL
jgi:hypothetical protein